ncbi:hypothetical protein EPIR_1087 [Erwinia piriflorinigrans CFBP 5888]|uniref:Uncharacterized protein n=1 Tax=Erwinia piriflorinigrans CFBP 5888 TaxID=1161919 RepID=V5Z6A3_9GAMM|nr:hypothetical protein EPIR_1087 [Erwinia piriflorinigrans CFBP 5888]
MGQLRPAPFFFARLFFLSSLLIFSVMMIVFWLPTDAPGVIK